MGRFGEENRRVGGLRYGLLVALYLLPQGIERVEIGADRMLGGEQLDAAKAALELCRRPAQSLFRIDIELAGEIGDGEEDVAQLLFQFMVIARFNRIKQFIDFLNRMPGPTLTTLTYSASTRF